MTEPKTTDSDVPTADDGDEGSDIAEPRHSNGPWKTNSVYPFGAYGEDKPVKRRDGVLLAAVQNIHDIDEDEAWANAELIAAAPELSAALHNLIREAEDAADALEALGDDGDAGMLRHQIEDAKRALNKARGAA